ncbi:MAG: selenium-dependent molybdenum cofactor biosynthesis protein YqeB [Desulfobacteraceae bacterium]
MNLNQVRVLVRGAGDIASAVAWRLNVSHFPVVMTEIPRPLAVRRRVAFCEAVWDGTAEVQGVRARCVGGPEEVEETLARKEIPLLVDPDLKHIRTIAPGVLVDATLAKRNTGVHRDLAPLVIGVGPGFFAGRDVHMVVETNRGHYLGRVLLEGGAEPDTGVPGPVLGYTEERVLRAPAEGLLEPSAEIGDKVVPGQAVASVGGVEVHTQIAGVLRGLIRPGAHVSQGLKIGDVDPRGDISYVDTISDKGLAVAGGVLEALCRIYNNASIP